MQTRLAGLGYFAFAADHHGGGIRLPMEQAMPRLIELMGEPERTRSLARAAFDVLLAEPGVDAGKIAAIGFCFAGTTSLEQRTAFEEEMRAGGVDYRVNVYGGAVNSFTNQAADALGMPAIKYHGPTDARSWRAMIDLFDERFGAA